MAFFEKAAEEMGWDRRDFAAYMRNGGRTRIRALGDWYRIEIEPRNRTPQQVMFETRPEISLAATIRTMKVAGARHYRAKELVTQVAAFYANFSTLSGIGSNKIITSLLAEWESIPKVPQKYTDTMPVERLVEWLRGLGENEGLPRYELYRKFVLTVQLACIARTSDIFRLRYDTFKRDPTTGVVTFVTITKTSHNKGVLLYLFGVPDAPRVCPVQTTLALREKFQREIEERGWLLPAHVFHVNKDGRQLKSPAQLSAILSGIHKEAGIDTQKWKVNNARHAIITFYKTSGVAEEQIKLITGHSQHSRVTQDFYTLPQSDWAARSILAQGAKRVPPDGKEQKAGAPITQVTDRAHTDMHLLEENNGTTTSQ
jgi:hypothetical protein